MASLETPPTQCALSPATDGKSPDTPHQFPELKGWRIPQTCGRRWARFPSPHGKAGQNIFFFGPDLHRFCEYFMTRRTRPGHIRDATERREILDFGEPCICSSQKLWIQATNSRRRQGFRRNRANSSLPTVSSNGLLAVGGRQDDFDIGPELPQVRNDSGAGFSRQLHIQ